MPSIPSLSNLIIGVYFYCRFIKEQVSKLWILAIVFLTLTVLSRTSYLFFYLSIFAIELYRQYHFKKVNWLVIKSAAFSIMVVAGYFIYNLFLRKEYGSLFLSHTMPADNFEEFKYFAKLAWDNLKTVYFSKKQYYIILFLLLFSLLFIVRQRIKNHNRFGILLAVFIWISTFAFFISMEQQFINHDYYFLDSFMFPILFTVILAVGQVRKFKFDSALYLTVIVGCVFFFRKDANAEQLKAYTVTPWDVTSITYNNFKNFEKVLTKNNVPKDAIILCYNANPPNLPFYYMKREGIPVLDYKAELIKTTIDWNYDYMVFQNEMFLTTVYEVYPEIINHFEIIDTDGKVSLCRKLFNPKNCSLEEFLQLEKYQKVYCSKDQIDKGWEKAQKKGDYYLIEKTDEFGATYKNKALNIKKNESLILKFKGKLIQHDFIGGNLVFSVAKDGENIYYKSFDTKQLTKDTNETEILLVLPLPQVEIKNTELGIHIWNLNKTSFSYKDFEFIIYKVE